MFADVCVALLAACLREGRLSTGTCSDTGRWIGTGGGGESERASNPTGAFKVGAEPRARKEKTMRKHRETGKVLDVRKDKTDSNGESMGLEVDGMELEWHI